MHVKKIVLLALIGLFYFGFFYCIEKHSTFLYSWPPQKKSITHNIIQFTRQPMHDVVYVLLLGIKLPQISCYCWGKLHVVDTTEKV